MSNRLPRAILFDLDDTIIQHSNADEAWRAVLGGLSERFDGHRIEDVHRAITARSRWFWSDPDRHRMGRLDNLWSSRQIIGQALVEIKIDDPQLVDEIGSAYRAHREASTKLFPGATETVQRFREMGARVGLITNGGQDVQRRKIEKFALEPLFDFILIEGEFGVGKPDERVYLHVLKEFGAQPKDAWMVGDNLEWEVAAPQKLGMAGIWVDHASKGLPQSSAVRPYRIVRLIRELLEE